MSVTFPPQANGQVADATYINSLADAVEAHDAALEAIGADVHGTGNKYLTTAATKATTASTTDVAVADYTVTVDLPAGRMVEFVARLRAQSTVAGDVALFRLRQTSVTGALTGEEHLPLPTAGVPYGRTIVLPWRAIGAGTQTFLLTVHRSSGTGTITVTTGGPTLPAIFYVRDIAPDTQFTTI